jgi:hypothetical protein
VCDLASPKMLYKKTLTIAALNVSIILCSQDCYKPISEPYIHFSLPRGHVPLIEPDGRFGGTRKLENNISVIKNSVTI